MAKKRTIGQLAVVLNAPMSGLVRNFKKAERIMVAFSNKAKQVGTNLTAMGRSMTFRVTAPIVAAAGAAIGAFTSFDKAMTESLAIMGNVNDFMKDEMAKTATLLSTKVKFSATELAKGYFFLASAGLDATQSIKALGPVAKFAQAGVVDMARATELLAGAQAALGLTSKDTVENQRQMIRVGDVLVKANTLAQATTEQFASALTTQAAAAMRQLGISLEEGTAVLAAYAKQNIQAENAGTMFARFLRLTIRAVLKNKEEWQRLGLTVFDAAGNLRNVADIMEDMETVMGKMTKKQKIANLLMLGFQARSQQAILPLIGMSKQIRIFQRELEQAGGITEEVANKQMKALGNQLLVIRNRVVNMARTFGQDLAPVVRKIGAGVTWLTKKVGEMSPAMRKTILAVAAVAASIGPLLMIFGLLALAVAGAIKFFVVFVPAILVAIPVFLKIAAAIAVMTFAVKEIATTMGFSWKGMKNLIDDSIQWWKVWGKFVVTGFKVVGIEIKFAMKILRNSIEVGFFNIANVVDVFIKNMIIGVKFLVDSWKKIFEGDFGGIADPKFIEPIPFRDALTEGLRMVGLKNAEIAKVLAQPFLDSLLTTTDNAAAKLKKTAEDVDRKAPAGLARTETRFAAAVEKGTIEAARAEARGKSAINKVAQNTAEAVDELQGIAKNQEETNDILGNTLGNMQVVNIA